MEAKLAAGYRRWEIAELGGAVAPKRPKMYGSAANETRLSHWRPSHRRRHEGTVVAVIDTGEFSDQYDASWSYLETGVLVMTKEAGLVHYPTAEWLEISN
jgi:hypothetical protein